MGVDTKHLCREADQTLEELHGNRAAIMYAAADELDTLRAQNAALVNAAQKQDQREHELMMERRELALAIVRVAYLNERGFNRTGSPLYLAERVLAEPVANPRAISGDNAPDLAQGGANV